MATFIPSTASVARRNSGLAYPGYWVVAEGQSNDSIKKAQGWLKALGYSTPVTGKYDSNTRRAVSAFAKAEGLGDDQEGRFIDEDMWEALQFQGGSAKAGQGVSTFLGVGQLTTQIASAFLPSLAKDSNSSQAPEQVVVSASGGGTNWPIVIGGGLAVVALVGGIIYVTRR